MMEQRSKTSISFFTRATLTLLFAVLFALDAVGQNSNEVPYYNLDYIKGGTGYIFIQGWTVDKTYRDRELGVDFVIYEDAACNNIIRIWAGNNVFRPDVNVQYTNTIYTTTGNHGFQNAIPIYEIMYDYPEGANEHTFYIKAFVTNVSGKRFEMTSVPVAVTVRKMSGTGLEESPFIICNSGDWDSFADDMADDIIGDFYTDKFYELANEDWCEFDNTTPVTKMWGTDARPFTGNFNGNGKTLNVNIIKNNTTDGLAAPFYHVNGASIHDLTVAGSVSGMYFAGGIVLIASGTLSLQNCVCSAAISGFNFFAGGLIGCCNDLTLKLNNCLFKGSFSPGSNGKYHPIALKNASATVKASAAMTFYLNTFFPSTGLGDNLIIGAQGFPVSKSFEDGVWDEPVTLADGKDCYAAHFTGKRLDYSYSFSGVSNQDVLDEGWTVVDCDIWIFANWFVFNKNVDHPQYLISPEFDGYEALSLSFIYYLGGTFERSFKFQLGYSTTTNDIEAFHWGDEIKHTVTETLYPEAEYREEFPSGVKYIAIKAYDVNTYMEVKNFIFRACPFSAPTHLSLSKNAGQQVTLTWGAPDAAENIIGYSYQYKKMSEDSWSDEFQTTSLSADLSDIVPHTNYNFRVRTIYSTGYSDWLPIAFTTAVALPYEYGFEDVTDAYSVGDGWSMYNCALDNRTTFDFDLYSGVRTYAARSCNRGFSFYKQSGGMTNISIPQCLISPCLPNNTPITLSFYYRNRTPEASRHEKFKVGYSTTTNDFGAFTWDDEIDVYHLPWTKYEKTFPEGTKYIAVGYVYDMNGKGLFIDDFIFECYSSKQKPTNLVVSTLTNQNVTLAWTAPNGATGYAYQFKKADDSTWPAETTTNDVSVTMLNLDVNTTYDFRVKAQYSGGEISNYETLRLLSEGPVVSSNSLPYTEGFENGMGGWRIKNGHVCTTNFLNVPEYVYKGNYSFQFWAQTGNDNNSQYLISPQFDGQMPMKVSFYYKKGNNNITYFQVGYSTTNKNSISDFHWQPVVKISDVEWHQYADYCPDGTKYFAVRWITGDFLHLDDITFESTINIENPNKIMASDITATKMDISWAGNAEKFELQYREKALFADDFEGGMVQWKNFHNNYPSDWRVLELSRNNYINHVTQSTNILMGYDDDNNVIQVGELDVDEWFVSPKVKLTGTLGFMAHFYSKSFDASYDKCEVLVSTTTDKVPGAFTSIGTIDASTSNSYFELEQYFYSLDSYNGQEGYIAFRHKSKNSSWLIIDDVSIYRTSESWTSISTREKSVNLTELRPHTDYEFQVRVLQDNYISNWSDLTTFTTEDYKSLSENATNTQTIAAIADGKKHDVILQGRTFYRHRYEWNTLCLPFSLSDFNGTPLEGATVKTFSSSDFTDGTLTLNFTEATSIEAGQPYIVQWANGADLLINDDSEWTAFAERVNSGETFAGKNVMLGADISVTDMAGTADRPFCGTFDGNGHTINLYINQPDADYAAPFRYINGATICNVKVTGSIKGGDYCSGLVGAALGGTNSIHDCWMAATVTTGGSQIGGILGHGTTSATTIANCYMNGTLSTTNIGVFYGGGSEGGTHTLANCWAAGTYNRGMKGSINLLLADGGTVSVTNCRHDDDAITQGTKILLITSGDYAFRDFLGSQWTLDGNGRLILKPSSERAATDIENPVFYGVTLSSNAPTAATFAEGQFRGSYSPIVNTDDWLLDAHNAGNGAFHAAISLNQSSLGSDFVNWYYNTVMTTPATAIPFDADGKVTLYAGWEVELADAADNSSTIDAIIGSGKANNKIVVLNGRTFYHDGNWNTLCVPFGVSNFSDTPLEGATVMKLGSSNLSGSTLTLNFTEVTSIEAGQPYIVKWQDGVNLTINSDADWTAFAQRVASGETFAGKNVLLGADINVSTMVGTADYPFCGTFDGAGHTLNVSIDQTDVDYAAPFRYINGATIRSVKVTGSVKGGDYCAGLVGAALGGTNSIHDCWMAASVDTYGLHIGGIVGHGTTSVTTVSNCYQNSSLHATSIGIFYGGGSEGGIHTLEQSWFLGNYSNPVMTGALDMLIADGGTVNVTNCRKTTSNDITQGETIIFSNEALVQFLGSQWTLDGNGMAVLKQTTTLLDSEIHNPVFTGVTINSAAPTAVTSQDGRVAFVGNYDPFVIDDSNIDEIIYLGTNNTIGYASAPRTLRAFRAHFVVSAGSANHAAIRQVLF
ncbi:MAG: fibronectin type III domain-containing protein, partial [Bacteroidaceae bacterium]|nr:fibronectin type III domain-containing protein [Bacteroidaceae bacterium]